MAARIDTTLRTASARIEPHEAMRLLAHVLERSPTWIFAHGDTALDEAAQTQFASLLGRRIAGEPLAYVLRSQGFWTLDLEVTPATLIPRADTERLVELALERIDDGARRIADLGTGAGAVALAIARERPAVHVIATDASHDALDVARRNAVRNGTGNVEFRHGDWCAPLDGRFDVIVSNPPYIADADPHLAVGDLRHEPAAALASGVDGLDAIRRIVKQAGDYLERDGWLLLEHGWDQGTRVRDCLRGAGYRDVETQLDLEHRDRVSLGRAPG